MFGLHVGVKPTGGGDVKTTESCAPTGTVDCSGASATGSSSVDDTSPLMIAAEGLVHVTQALRLGAGYGLVPYASFKSDDASESEHIGSEHHLVGIVEGIIPVSPSIDLALRFQGGASMLLVGGDLADAQQAAVASCDEGDFPGGPQRVLCQSDKGPYFGANYALMAGILAGGKVRFRGDLALERFTYQVVSTDTTYDSGTVVHGELQLYGTRFWIFAGFEL